MVALPPVSFIWLLVLIRQCPSMIRQSKFVGFFREFVRELRREDRGLVFRQTVLGDESREERAIDAPRDVVARRDRQECARVVVEAHGVVETRGFGRLLAETHHAFRAVVEPPGGPELERGVMARERREL